MSAIERDQHFDPRRDLIVEEIRLTDLRFDKRYQRIIDPKHVALIARTFDVRKAGLVVVSLRQDGRLVVIDGQHRVDALRMIDPFGSVSCVVYAGLSLSEEAALFSELNRDRKSMSSMDMFWADFIAGNPVAVGVALCVEQGGFTLMRAGVNGRQDALACFTTLRDAYRYDAGQTLSLSLQVLAESWGREHAPRSMAVQGMSRFIFQYQGLYKRNRLFAVVGKLNERQFEAGTKTMSGITAGGLATAGGRYVHTIYNTGLRTNRLPEWEATLTPWQATHRNEKWLRR